MCAGLFVCFLWCYLGLRVRDPVPGGDMQDHVKDFLSHLIFRNWVPLTTTW